MCIAKWCAIVKKENEEFVCNILQDVITPGFVDYLVLFNFIIGIFWWEETGYLFFYGFSSLFFCKSNHFCIQILRQPFFE